MAKTSVDKKYIRASIENVQTNQITISEDKLRIKLENQIKRIKRGSGSLSYLGLAITSIGVLVTAELKTVFGITPDMWKTVFFIVAVISFCMFLYSIINIVFWRVTVDTIVEDIKTADKEDKHLPFWTRLVTSVTQPVKRKNAEIEEDVE